ncbi:MAG: MATE family efflux transporter [Clostridiales bacterium]|nr:MATE family efflux transporter [Clostridiales bacterium]
MTKSISKEDKRRDFILGGNLYKIIIKLALPIMLSNLIQTVYSLTDTYFVSTIGDNQVAAVGFVWPMIFLYMALGMGISIGAMAIMSQRIGAKDDAGAVEVAGQTLSFMFIISGILALVGYLVAPWLIRVLGGEGIIYSDGLKYSRLIIVGMPMMYFYFAFQAIKQAEGNMLTPMLILVGSVVLNMILDPLFIIVFKWGVEGAALATTLSRLAAVIVVVIIIWKNKNSRIHEAIKHLKLKKDVVMEIVKVGMPTAIGRMTSSVGFMIMNMFVISYGAHIMTAFVLGNRITSLVMMPAFGIGSATTTIIGQNMGAGNLSRCKETLKKTLVTSVGISLIGMALIYIFKSGIIGIFTSTEAVLTSAKKFTDIVILTLPLMAIFQVMSGFFIGTKHTTTSMTADIARLWVFRIPMIILFKYVFHMDEYAIWYPMIISNLLTCIILTIVYATKRWQTPPRKWKLPFRKKASIVE